MTEVSQAAAAAAGEVIGRFVDVLDEAVGENLGQQAVALVDRQLERVFTGEP